MSDFERFCPICASRVEKWEFTAPIDHYRCYLCLAATPFHELPRRNMLRFATGLPEISQRIALGTAATSSPSSTLTMSPVIVRRESLLVVGAVLVSSPADPPVNPAGATRGSQTFTATALAGSSVRTTTVLFTLASPTPGPDSVVISTLGQGNHSIAAFATEITNVTSSPVDASGTNSATGPAASASVTSSMTDNVNEIAIAVVGNQGDVSSGVWGSSFAGGQQRSAGTTAAQIYEGHRILTTTGAITASISSISSSEEWAMCIATFRAALRTNL